MTEIAVKKLEGIIQEIDEELVFVEVAGDINEAQAFIRRPNMHMLKEGTPVDVVSLVFQFGKNAWGSYEVYGVKTKGGEVIYDLTKDNSNSVPYLVSEAKALFPEAEKLLYEK